MASRFRQPFDQNGQQTQYRPPAQLHSSRPQMQAAQQTMQTAGPNTQQVPRTEWVQPPSGQPSAIPVQTGSSGRPIQGWPQGPYGQQPPSGSMGQPMQRFDTQAQSGHLPSPQSQFEWTGEQPLFGSPAVDIVNKPDEIRLFVNLPGFDKNDIQIQGDGRRLTIFAEHMADPEDEAGFIQRERPTTIQRTIQLPVFTEIGNATATFEDGICKITLPKSEDAKEEKVGFQ